MPSMFSEADLDTFQRLRCAFDPRGLANPGKVMPTPRLCGEVPGPYREHPLERDGRRNAFLMPRTLRPATFEEAAAGLAAAAAEGQSVRIRGAGTKARLGGAGRRARRRASHHGPGRDRRAQRR